MKAQLVFLAVLRPVFFPEDFVCVFLSFCVPAQFGCAVYPQCLHPDPHVKRYETWQQGSSRRVGGDKVRVTRWKPVDENWAEEVDSLQLHLLDGKQKLKAE